MRAPLSWLRQYADLPQDLTGRQLADALVRAGLEVETVERTGPELAGPVVVGRVLSAVDEPQRNGKTIKWCLVDVGPDHPPTVPVQTGQFGQTNGAPLGRGIVCGAPNVAPGQLVVVALPGAELAGGFKIAARKTYGHLSDGMICAADELGLGGDHSGILVLPPTDDAGRPLVPGQPAGPLLGTPDEVLDIAVTPDLGYCLSLRGLAREAAQAYGVAFHDPAARTTPAPRSDGWPVRLETAACPLFVALTVEGLDPTRTSPGWLTRRLQAVGLRPLGLAIDVTNYVMMEIGQPIHGYDGDRLTGAIVVRQARPGESLTTLDGQTRRLDPLDLVIADDTGAIGLAGVMGGQTTELGPDTVKVVIEAAYFDPVAVARTAKAHKLPSEASRRFERQVDPGAAYAAAHRVAELLVQLGGGRLSGRQTVAGGVPQPAPVTIAGDLPGRVLGHPTPPRRVESILTASGCAVTAAGDELTVRPPTWRPDLRDPYDLVEEVGRKIGFGEVRPALPRARAGRGRTPAQQARQRLNWALPAAGFVEVVSFPFVSAQSLDQLLIAADDDRRRLVGLANPLADTAPYLRTTLLPGLFAAVARNRSRGLDDLALYEQGAVFLGPAGPAPVPPVDRRPSADQLAAIDAALPRQPRHLACVVTGDWSGPGWSSPALAAGWTQAVGFAQLAARTVGLELARRADQRPPWHPGRCARLLAGESVVGWAGELHPTVVSAFGLPEGAAAAELDLDALIAALPGPGQLPGLSSFPVVKQDVALMVDAAVPQGEVVQALRQGGGDLLESLALFDVYSGPPVPPGQKSLAFALRFRAPDRTLTEDEAAQARDAAVQVAAERCGAVQRVA
ncbi:MAG: phenylalanine--tRNA ligase subunit beta [Propionibacteriaceae bacterium]|jgi:phenylalanyl-tRNA synthetase beta chain|nr:phenylalanine--tRNA ligase subunit beta [Propionibacteriaceae bacterium]